MELNGQRKVSHQTNGPAEAVIYRHGKRITELFIFKSAEAARNDSKNELVDYIQCKTAVRR